MFQIKAIQARHGDALLISYGEIQAPRHLLVDGGPAGTLDSLISVLDSSRVGGRLVLDVLVVTHYDLDHIEGIIELLSDKPDWLDINDVWFNGYMHLHARDRLGKGEGDELAGLISGKYKWNHAFGEEAVQQSAAPVLLSDGMTIYVLSPDKTKLDALKKIWTDPSAVPIESLPPSDLLGRKDSWPPGAFGSLIAGDRFTPDRSVPNGSSISLLLEYGGRRLLLAADSHASTVQSGLSMCLKPNQKVDLLKVSHHGSKANTNATLIKALGCRRFLISTNGNRHEHPDHQLIARLVNAAPTGVQVYFNYAVKNTLRWADVLKIGWPKFEINYPVDGEDFICINV